MKVYQALKLKRNLISSISQLSELIQNSNSAQSETEFECDVRELLEQRKKKVVELTELKIRLNRTASAIQYKIYELSELKLELQMLRGINTKQGMIPVSDYSDAMVERKVQLNKAEVLRLTERVIGDIDRIQGEIDEFNYITELAD